MAAELLEQLEKVPLPSVSVMIRANMDKSIMSFGRYTDASVKTLRTTYFNASRDIERAIRDRAFRQAKGAPLSSLETIRLSAMKDDIDRINAQLNEKLRHQIPEGVTRAGSLGEQAGAAELDILSREIPRIGFPQFAMVNRETVQFYSNYALTTSINYGNEAMNAIKRRLDMALVTGAPWGKVAREVRTILREKSGLPTSGLHYKAQRIVRTELVRAFAAGHSAYGQACEFVIGETFHTNMGACIECEPKDGQTFIYSKDGVPTIPLHPHCFASDTEVYTKDGWKLFSDLNEGDLILSLTKNWDLEFAEIKWVFQYKYKGNMVRFYSTNLDLVVTPDHPVLCQYNYEIGKRSCNLHRKAASVLYKSNAGSGTPCFYRSSKWRGTKKQFIKIGNSQILDAFDFCTILGYFLSDGYFRKWSNKKKPPSYRASICQYREPQLTEIYDNLVKIKGIKISKQKSSILIQNQDFGCYVSQFGKAHDKFIPDEIKSLPKKYLVEFLRTFTIGDGFVIQNYKHHFKGSRDRTFSTSSPRLAADLGELLLKIGHRPSYYLNKSKERPFKSPYNGKIYWPNYNVWQIRDCKKQYSYIFKKELVPYNNFVYDVELEKNHTLYVRRNGKCVWSSNCRCYSTYLFSKNLFNKEELERLKPRDIAPRGHLEERLASEAIISQMRRDAAAAGVKLTEKRANEIYGSVRRYSGLSYKPIRAFQQGGLAALRRERLPLGVFPKDVQRYARDIEQYLKFSPSYKGKIFRGIGGTEHVPSWSNLKAGDIIDMRGTSSWTSMSGEAEEFGRVVFECPKVTRGASIRHMTVAGAGEDEILVSKLSRFRVATEPIISKDRVFIIVEEF